MIIRYRKKQIISDIIVGSLYLITGILGIIFDSEIFKYAFTALGILYLGSGFYKLKFQYIKVQDQVLTRFEPGNKKKVDLKHVTRIKKFTDEITFLTPNEKLKISTNLIDKEDLPAFENLLASLDLEQEKNPFANAVKTN